jgi:hypothetical protein
MACRLDSFQMELSASDLSTMDAGPKLGGRVGCDSGQLFQTRTPPVGLTMGDQTARPERFSVEREREITPVSRQRIEEMPSRYVTRLRDRSRVLRGRLEPVLAVIAGGNIDKLTLAAEPDWQSQALTLFKSVERAHQLAGRLFTGVDGISLSPEQAARHMLDALAGLDAALEALDRLSQRRHV